VSRSVGELDVGVIDWIRFAIMRRFDHGAARKEAVEDRSMRRMAEGKPRRRRE